MTQLECILHNNRQIKIKIAKHNALIQSLENQVRELREQIKKPCGFCPYDGVYRCEACREHDFAGFNIKDFPG